MQFNMLIRERERNNTTNTRKKRKRSISFFMLLIYVYLIECVCVCAREGNRWSERRRKRKVTKKIRLQLFPSSKFLSRMRLHPDTSILLFFYY